MEALADFIALKQAGERDVWENTKLCLQTVKYLSPCFAVTVQTVDLRFGDKSVLKEQSSELGGFCALQDGHTTAVTKEKPKNRVLVVIIIIIVKATVCMKQKQAWHLQMDNNLKTGMLPQSVAYAVCILSGIPPVVFPDGGSWNSRNVVRRPGCAQALAVSSQDPLAGRSSFTFKAVLNCGLKYRLEMHFALLVLVLCVEIPLSPATGTEKWDA